MTTLNLANRLWPSSTLARNAALAVLGSLFVAAAAHIALPTLPVPVTMQTLAVLAVGAAFGARLGAATMALYALEGAIGLPVFAPTPDGYPGLSGPTAGYIMGFIFAAYVVGLFTDRGWDRSIPKMLGGTLLGAAVLYVPGLIWLSTYVGGFDQAIQYGLAPFWLADAVKATIAALAFPAIWKLLGTKS